jgi:hypothetical protein
MLTSEIAAAPVAASAYRATLDLIYGSLVETPP